MVLGFNNVVYILKSSVTMIYSESNLGFDQTRNAENRVKNAGNEIANVCELLFLNLLLLLSKKRP
ncbi:MAG TPA: hypothetical protein DGG95_09640 [Cytophagales bacterium]|nr:hypothetical protein [Cytophagales bacterium]